MNKEKTGEEIKIEKSIEFYLYHSTQSIKLQRIILQKDITPDLEALKAMGVQWVEVENQFSSKEFFNEYEINILNDKDATIIPLSFDLSEIMEGPVAVVLGKNLEDQWVKAEIRAIEDRFEILEKPEIQLIKDRKDLAEIYAQEKDAAIRITTAALEQNITEQLEKDKETIGEEEKGIEEKSTEKAVETSETQTLPEEKVVVEENQKAEISDNATEKISPEEKPSLSRMKIKTSQMENPEVAITGALYELQNVETKESYKTNSSNEEGIAVVEVPYGEYKIDQIASGFAYEIAINIPEIQIKSETESILIENEIKTLNLEARPKEESPKDLVLSRSRDMASLSMMAMEPMMALAAIGPVTANGNGSIGGSLGNYSWSAVANGNTINWTFNVSKIARSVVNPDTSNYFDFSIPSYLTLVGTPAITGGILVNQGNGVYSGYSDNDRTARTTVVTFSTTINDPSRTSYEIEFRPSVRQSRYNAAVYYTFDFYQADTTSVIQSSIRTTSPATIGPLGLKIVPATLYYSPMQYGSLSIYKEDILGNSLTGAVFTLTGTSDYGDSITRTFDLRNLNNSTELNIPYGNYTLTETVTPVNYDPIPPQQVAINASTKSLTIVNHRSRGSLTVNKVDQDNLPLQGSTFVLTNGQLTFNFVMTNLSSQK